MNFRAYAIGAFSFLLAACTTGVSPLPANRVNSISSTEPSAEKTTQPLPVVTPRLPSPIPTLAIAEAAVQLLPVATLETNGGITHLEFSSNSNHGELVLAAGSYGTNSQTYLWSVPTGQLLTTFPGYLIGFAAGGESLITEEPASRTVQVFNVATEQRVGLLTAMVQALNPARTAFVSISGRVIDIASGQELHTVEPSATDGFIRAFSPDGKKLVTVNDAARVSMLDIETGQVLQTFTPQHLVTSTAEHISEVVFNPTGQHLANVESEAVRIWNVSSGQEEVLLSEKGILTWITFSPDGRFLVVGHADGALSIWDWVQAQKYEFPGQGAQISYLAFSPDGHFLAVGFAPGGGVKIWEVKNSP